MTLNELRTATSSINEDDAQVWYYESTDSYVNMSPGTYSVVSLDDNSADYLLSINLTNETAFTTTRNSTRNVDVSAVLSDPQNSNSDYTGLSFMVKTQTSEYGDNSLKAKFWLNDDTTNAVTKDTRCGTDSNSGETTHSVTISDIQSLFAPQTISDCDVLHYQFIAN